MGAIYFSRIPVTDQTVEKFLQRGTYIYVELNFTLATESCLPTILRNTNLRVLSLRGIPLRDEGVQRIAELKELVTADLWGPDITNDCVRILEQSPSLDNLQIVECPKVDDGVFDTLANFRHLKGLLLSGNAKITDAGLAKVKNLSMLVVLRLEASPRITADGVAKLRTARPNLTVVWDRDAKDVKKPESVELGPVPADLHRKVAE